LVLGPAWVNGQRPANGRVALQDGAWVNMDQLGGNVAPYAARHMGHIQLNADGTLNNGNIYNGNIAYPF